MKLWTKFRRWWTDYDARMRVLALLSRDEALTQPHWARQELDKLCSTGLVFQVGLYKYKLTDAGAAAVEEWRAGR